MFPPLEFLRFMRILIVRGYDPLGGFMNNKAFTLIELLVVVLIIGILSAIAVSQYQKAVLKARVMSGMAIGKAMMNAMDMWYLEHGSYGYDSNKFILTLPAGAQNADGTPLTSFPTSKEKKIFYNVGNGIPLQFTFEQGGRLAYKIASDPEININFCSRYAKSVDKNSVSSSQWKNYKYCSQLQGRITCTYGSNKQKAQCERLGARYFRDGTYAF